ncbi:MAG: ketoacyl-ACP synthase III [Clostridium sp.]|nr:ketoacyl-ACP synthase III [Clostridium sp.]MCM1399499.1 ketoacyl-ACP synthase III [Clostridium sp.]MCM1460053.1 ketoacyl-ACP synthase III [Bacteroides sp.]
MLVKDGLRIVATGHYVPDKVVTNDDLSKLVDTNDEWISSRTGIRRRHFVENESNLDLALNAARLALERSGIDKEELGVCIVATVKPDNLTPSMACLVQAKLGLPEEIPCFDINAACSGFMYAMQIARGLLMNSDRKYGLVVGSETLSRMLDMTDRGTCVLFGDGAGAAIIELTDKNRFFSVLGSRGNDEVLVCSNQNNENRYLSMIGSDVFRFAVSTVPKAIHALLDQVGLTADDIDYFICHQANFRIIESVAKKCKQPIEKFYVNLDEYGNTSSASIPIAMDEMNEKGLLKPGMKIICVGFGAGLTWGGAYLEW